LTGGQLQEFPDELWKTWLGEERAIAFESVSARLNIQDATIWNQRISAALWIDISVVEVALRNKVSTSLQHRLTRLGIQERWMEDPTGEIFKAGGRVALQRIAEAAANARRFKKASTETDLIAELSLGFWKAFFTKPFQAFHPDLVSTFEGLNHRNFQVPARLVAQFHGLRNRVAHHHRMLHRDLLKDSQVISSLARALDPKLEQFLNQRSSCPNLIDEFNQIVQAGC
jgi:hypothetical protein